MSSLFDNDNERDSPKSLKISGKPKTQLSKKQLQFNKLTKQIETLQADIKKDEIKLNRILKEYTDILHPAKEQNAERKMAMAKMMAASTISYKYGKNQIVEVGKAICELFRQAFVFVVPDAQTIALFDKWSETSYKEQVEMDAQDVMDMFSDLVYEQFGVDVDLSEVGNKPEDIAEFTKKLKEEIMNKTEGAKPGKKTKKQLEQEASAKAKNDVKLKSLRHIYIGLAKILHPDTETDPHLRAKKEELMKKVTVAYDKKDLSTLLKLEMQWVTQETLHIETLADDKLNIYISFLKEQVSDLEFEQSMLFNNPRYASIEEFVNYSEKDALYLIRDSKTKFNANSADITASISDFSGPGGKKEIINFVQFFNALTEKMNSFIDIF